MPRNKQDFGGAIAKPHAITILQKHLLAWNATAIFSTAIDNRGGELLQEPAVTPNVISMVMGIEDGHQGRPPGVELMEHGDGIARVHDRRLVVGAIVDQKNVIVR
jgi:hypothetical protein